MKTILKKHGGNPARLLPWLVVPAFITGLVLLPPVIELGADLQLGASAFAARPAEPGGGGGDNGVGPGGGGSGGPGGGGKSDKGELFGDVVYIDRNVNGVPYADLNHCVRPIVPDTGELIPLYGDDDTVYPSGIPEEWLAVCGEDFALAAVIAEDEEGDEPCDVQPQCAYLLVEPEQGRLSLIRSPEKVLDRQRDDAARTIEKADAVWLGPGGRPVADGIVFDSPLISMALYRDFLRHGYLAVKAVEGEAVWTPGIGPAYFGNGSSNYEPLLGGAFGLGGGADKTLEHHVDVEIVARTAETLALQNGDLGGHSGPVNYPGDAAYTGDREYVDLSGFSGYDRADTYPGQVCWFELDEGYKQASIINAALDYPVSAISNISGFAQAAEDARNVIVFVHDPSDHLEEPALLIWADNVFENVLDGTPCGD